MTVTVTGEAAYPVAITDSITTAINTPITFDALANDTGAGLSIIEINEYSRNGGKVAIVDGKLRYTPKSGYTGDDRFWYAIKDSLGRTNAARVTIVIE